MRIKNNDANIVLIQDNSSHLKELKKINFLVQFIPTIGLYFLFYSFKIIIIYFIGIGIMNYYSYIKHKKNKFILEEMDISKNEITIKHIVERKIKEKKIINYLDLEDIYYSDFKKRLFNFPNKSSQYFSETYPTIKSVEKKRKIKLKLKGDKVISFGLFITEEEAKEIQEIILKSKNDFKNNMETKKYEN